MGQLVARGRGLVPLRPGPARLGQDLDGRAAHRAPARPRQARRRRRDRATRRSTTCSRRSRRPRARPASVPRAEEGDARGTPSRSTRARARSRTPRTPASFDDADHDLFAGTAWLFAREELDGKLDYLFVDEAGQVSLADALALGTCARTLVLLGDPQQLAQVSQGVHPERRRPLGARAPARRARRPSPRTWASSSSAPAGCTPTSAASSPTSFYEGRLDSADACCGRQASSVRHRAPLAAGRARGQLDRVRGGGGRDPGRDRAPARGDVDGREGSTRPIGVGDILVVAPYNAQVRLLHGAAAGRRRGRHRRQVPGPGGAGRLLLDGDLERAPTPRAASTSSSRRNRLNVAVSRAQCLAYLVCAPALLDIDCRTIEQMRLVNALCRFVELAAIRSERAPGACCPVCCPLCR